MPKYGTHTKRISDLETTAAANTAAAAAKLPLAGGNVTGAVEFENNISLRWDLSAGTPTDALFLDGSDDLYVGSANFRDVRFRCGATGGHYWDVGGVRIAELRSDGVGLENGKYLRGEVTGGGIYELLGIDASDEVWINSGQTPGDVNFDCSLFYWYRWHTGGAQRASLNTSGLHLASGVRVSAFLDEDDMSSDSATALPTQQSTKAYVDNTVQERKSAAATASNVASVEVAIPSGAKEVRIKFQNVVPATDAVILRGRTSTDAGVSFDSGASDYDVTRINSGATAITQNYGALSYIPLNGSTVGNAANETGVSGEIVISRPDQAEYTDMWFRTMCRHSGSDAHPYIQTGGARRNAAADVDTFEFSFSSGNIASGEFQVSVIE